MQVSERQRRIGEVAKATGLTVRALHHYDEIGLLAPSGRSTTGYRLYSDADVGRLYRIVALRDVGFSLAEIGDELLRDGEDPRPALRRHIERSTTASGSRRRCARGSPASWTRSPARSSRPPTCSSKRSR
jgi:DNA-binding transcriptional MerR regulator